MIEKRLLFATHLPEMWETVFFLFGTPCSSKSQFTYSVCCFTGQCIHTLWCRWV